jgi:hypothetical protein
METARGFDTWPATGAFHSLHDTAGVARTTVLLGTPVAAVPRTRLPDVLAVICVARHIVDAPWFTWSPAARVRYCVVTIAYITPPVVDFAHVGRWLFE